MSKLRCFRLLPLIALAAATTPATAANIDADYRVTLAGFSIGTARLAGNIDDNRYQLSVSAALTGLVGAINGGKGAAQSNGAISGGRVLANAFALRASNGEMTRTIQIGANGGNVQSVAIEPPFDDKADRVPVLDVHKRGIIDPLGAMVMPKIGKDGTDPRNCDRTLPVFDGAQRFDIRLSYSGTRQVESEQGYRGPVIVCRARYAPLAGHRPLRRVTKFMVDNRDMDVWLAPLPNGGQLVPYRIAVRTMVGTAVIEARRFVFDGLVEPVSAGN